MECDSVGYLVPSSRSVLVRQQPQHRALLLPMKEDVEKVSALLGSAIQHPS